MATTKDIAFRWRHFHEIASFHEQQRAIRFYSPVFNVSLKLPRQSTPTESRFNRQSPFHRFIKQRKVKRGWCKKLVLLVEEKRSNRLDAVQNTLSVHQRDISRSKWIPSAAWHGWLAGSLVEAKNHLAEDLIASALGAHRWNAVRSSSGTDSLLFRTIRIRFPPAVPRKDTMPSFLREKTLIESSIKCRKLPPSQLVQLESGRVSEKHSSNFPSFDYAQLANEPSLNWNFSTESLQVLTLAPFFFSSSFNSSNCSG